MRQAWSIATKDLLEFRRDRRLLIVALGIVAALGVAVAGGLDRTIRSAAERADAQRAERDRWLGQGEVNPHAAAHYGTFVFAPVEPLGLIDPGITPLVASAIFLEAHQQQLSRHRPVEDAVSFRTLTAPSVATCLQIIAPLFIVFMAVGVARERERGTWQLLVATSGRGSRVLAGKALGVALGLAAVIGPPTLIAIVLLLGNADLDVDADTLTRTALLVAAYAVYLGTWLMLGLGIAVRAPSARHALAIGAILWLAAAVVAPVALMAASTTRTVAPNVAAFTAAIDDERALRPSWDDRVAAATDRFLRGEELPAASNPEVVALIDTEAADTELYGRHLRALAETFGRQAQTYAWLSWLSPTVAIQVTSMALSATDLAHYQHFSDATARYRTLVLESLNQELAGFDGWKTFNAAGNRDLWAQVPEFEYDTPAAGWAVRHLAGPAAGIVAWLLVSSLLLAHAMRRAEVRG